MRAWFAAGSPPGGIDTSDVPPDSRLGAFARATSGSAVPADMADAWRVLVTLDTSFDRIVTTVRGGHAERAGLTVWYDRLADLTAQLADRPEAQTCRAMRDIARHVQLVGQLRQADPPAGVSLQTYRTRVDRYADELADALGHERAASRWFGSDAPRFTRLAAPLLEDAVAGIDTTLVPAVLRGLDRHAAFLAVRLAVLDDGRTLVAWLPDACASSWPLPVLPSALTDQFCTDETLRATTEAIASDPARFDADCRTAALLLAS